MNKERYLKLKKDFIVLYLARNGIMTFLMIGMMKIINKH